MTSDPNEQLMEYEYDRLSSPGWFRILELKPGREGEDLSCDLKAYILEKPPSYEALSYVWGSNDTPFRVFCNGRYIRITKSLDDVLHHLRHQSTSRALWIDQICINQGDVQERGEQVQAMTSIYSRAGSVTVWLGPDELGKGPVAKTLVSQMCTCSTDSALSLSHFATDDVLQKLRLPNRTAPAWEALDSMLRNPYFERVWIIQEVLAAKEALIAWGQTEIAWEDFRTACKWAFKNNFHLIDTTGLTGHRCPSLPLPKIDLLFGTVPPRLFNLLTHTTSRKATDPRDKIYALVGMLDERDQLKVDYTLSPAQVFARATRHIIETTKNLDVLSYCSVGDSGPTDDVPRWAPTWNHTGCIPLHGLGFEATNIRATWEEAADWNVLSLSGFRLDTIQTASGVIHGNPFDHGWKARVAESFNLFKTSHGAEEKYRTSLIEPFVSVLVVGKCSDRHVSPLAAPQQSRLHAFASYVCNSVINEWATCEYISNQEGILGLAELALDACPDPSALHSSVAIPKETQEEAINSVAEYHLGSAESTAKVKKILERLLEVVDMEAGRTFQRYFEGVACPHRKIFTTATGWIGLGPACLGEDDIVCFLFGGPTLYAIRPTPEPGQYLLLGECYVHGLMNGEMIHLYAGRNLSPEWFHLI